MNEKKIGMDSRRKITGIIGILKEIFWMSPYVMLIGILPFCVRLNVVENKLSKFAWFSKQEQWGDLFLYSRMKLIIGIAILIITLFIIAQVWKNFPVNKWLIAKFILLLSFLVCCIISTLYSVDIGCSAHGLIEQFQSIWVWISYVIICFYGSFLIVHNHDTTMHKITANVLPCVHIFLGVLGLSQILGRDLLSSSFLRRVIVPVSLQDYGNRLRFSLQNNVFTSVYETFYHPNDAGLYLAMTLPLLIWIVLHYRGKWQRKTAFLALILQGICLCFTGAKSVFIALAGIMLIFILRLIARCGWTYYSTKWKSGNLVKEKVRRICGGIGISLVIVLAITLCLALQKRSQVFIKPVNEKLEDILVRENAVDIWFNEHELTFFYEKQNGHMQPVVEDEVGKRMQLLHQDGEQWDIEQNWYRLKDVSWTAGENLYFAAYQKNGISYIKFLYHKISWLFTDTTKDGAFHYVTIFGRTDEIVEASKAFDECWNGIFTYRGYIWNRTLPLLKERLWFGSGPDTFALVFPQNDYVGKAKQGKSFFSEVLVKPHNLYIQICCQLGMAALLSFLGLCFVCLFKRKNDTYFLFSKKFHFLDACRLSCIIYLIAGLTTDSSLISAPLFWLFLGTLSFGYGK